MNTLQSGTKLGAYEIIDLIGQQNGVAVTLFQWDEEADKQHMTGWHLLSGPASIVSFAAKVEALERSPIRKFTGTLKKIEDLVRLETLSDRMARFLGGAIQGRSEIFDDYVRPLRRGFGRRLAEAGHFTLNRLGLNPRAVWIRVGADDSLDAGAHR